ESLSVLDARLAAADVPVDRVVCHVDDRDELWQLVGVLESGVTSFDSVDVLVEVGLQGLAADAWLAAEALVALAPFPGVRIHLDTLVELDRTMDMRGGLLNRMCNPRPSFRVLQILNTVLHGRVVAGNLADTRRTAYGVRAQAGDDHLMLVVPGVDPAGRTQLDQELAELGSSTVLRYELGRGWVHRGPAERAVFAPTDPTAPYVLLSRRG
ncbi:MAG TPA: hypothetical protein VLB67_08470, partial [Acidimicrobiia bacterium]|nr:hypothetical protein [Acidimicrobiia bacterium]